MGLTRRRLLAAAAAAPVLLAASAATETVAAAADAATAAARPPAEGDSLGRCARCGSPDHRTLEPRCPAGAGVVRR